MNTHNHKSKLFYFLLGTFLSLIGISAIYYYDVGRWRNYVRYFGSVEILLLVPTAAHFVWMTIHKKTRSIPLMLLIALFCIAQFFPAAYALYALRYVNRFIIHFIFHCVVIFIGICILTLYKKLNTNLK